MQAGRPALNVGFPVELDHGSREQQMLLAVPVGRRPSKGPIPTILELPAGNAGMGLKHEKTVPSKAEGTILNLKQSL